MHIKISKNFTKSFIICYFFDIPLFYYYINLNSSKSCCLSFGETYLSFGISLLTSFDPYFFTA